jgi:hypothetical protein
MAGADASWKIFEGNLKTSIQIEKANRTSGEQMEGIAKTVTGLKGQNFLRLISI